MCALTPGYSGHNADLFLSYRLCFSPEDNEETLASLPFGKNPDPAKEIFSREKTRSYPARKSAPFSRGYVPRDSSEIVEKSFAGESPERTVFLSFFHIHTHVHTYFFSLVSHAHLFLN